MTKTALSQQMKSILQTPKKEPKSKDSKKYQNRNKKEEEQNSGIFDAVEETIENIFQQVDKAMEGSAKKNEDDSNTEEKEVPKTPGSTLRVASTRSSKLRKKSARSRLEMYKNLPPGRQEEYEAYAGEVLRSDKKKKRGRGKIIDLKIMKKA